MLPTIRNPLMGVALVLPLVACGDTSEDTSAPVPPAGSATPVPGHSTAAPSRPGPSDLGSDVDDDDAALPPEPDPSLGLDLDDARIGVGYRTIDTVGDGSVQEIVSEEIAEANLKYWGPENVSNELLGGPLKALKVLCLGPWGAASRPPEIADVFTVDARIEHLTAFDHVEQEVTHGVVRRVPRDGGEAPEVFDPAGWRAHLDGLFDEAKRVRWVLWKPAEVKLTDYGAEAVVKMRFNREMPSGSIEHASGKWKTEWVRNEDGEWRCRRAGRYKETSTLVSDAPHFVDSTLEALKGTALDPRLPSALDGVNRGLALADLDGDHDLDLVTTLPLTLLYNRGDGTFEDRTQVGLKGKNDVWTNDDEFFGVLVQDFDRDGDPDIMVAAKRTQCLLFRQAEGAFHPEIIEASLEGNIPASLSAHDVDGDGWLDVFVTGYGPFVHPGPNNPANATNARANQMLRGLPGGKFEDVTAAWGFETHGTRWTFIGAFGDADGDGDIDVYAANDFGPNVLYRRLDGDDVTFRAELEDPTKVDAGFSMSATFADLDGDLDQDLYVSNMSSTAARRVLKMEGDPREQRLGVDMDEVRYRMSKGNTILFNGDGLLTEAPESYGAKNGSWAWGTALFDYDCDGDVDIHSLNGMWSQGADDGRDL